jgi:hypothetical protein
MTTLHVILGVAAAVSLTGVPAEAESRQDAPLQSTPACLAVVLPSVQGVEGSATEVGSAVRDLFVSFLTGPSIKTISLEARLPSQAALEARGKDCGKVLLASVVRKRAGHSKLGGILGQTIGTAAWQIPYAGGGAVVQAAAVAGAQAVSSLASDTQAKDEMQLEYRVGTPETVAQVKPVSAKAKATVDGEDLLTPLVERAAEDIVSVIGVQ